MRNLSGKIKIEKGSCVLDGMESRFLSELGAKDVISVGKDSFVVAEVLGEGAARLETPSQTEIQEWTDARVTPHIDQNQVYHLVYERLRQGGCVGIFPEGGSHDRSQLLPLKAGVAVMALGASAKDPSLNVKIVPCGLNYFNPHRFRSRAVVEFGKPISVDLDLVEKFKLGGNEKREACAALLEQIQVALKSVTVNAADYESLQVIQAARRLYEPRGRSLLLSEKLGLTRMFAEAYETAKNEPLVKSLAEKVLNYNNQLRSFGIRDHQVMEAKLDDSFGHFFHRIFILVFSLVFAIPGVLLHLPIALLASYISKKKAKEALASSSVKIYGRDVLATWKLLVALVVTPLLYACYGFAAIYFYWPLDAGEALRVWVLTNTFTLAAGLIGLRLSDAFMDSLKSLKPLFLYAFYPQQTQTLKAQRLDLQKDVLYLIDELGPKIFPDFDKKRIINKKDRNSMYRQDLSDFEEDWMSWKSVSDDEKDDIFFFQRKAGTGKP